MSDFLLNALALNNYTNFAILKKSPLSGINYTI